MSRTLCMGNQALALGALKSGVNVVSGYPGTPSSEIVEHVSAQVIARGLSTVHVEWSSNEKVALEVGAGAAFAGARALVTMKQVGLNVAADALMSLPYLGVKGGLVLVVADDPGPISSQTEQDTRQFAAFAKVPTFDPTTPEEAFEMIQHAFELSERYQTPVIVRPTTRVCHSTAPIETDFEYVPHEIGGFDRGPRWVVFPRRAYEGHLEIVERLPKIASEFSASPFNSIEDTHATAASHIGIAASGISYSYLQDARAQLGNLGPLRILKLATSFPFPDQLARDFLEGLTEVLVLEEQEPYLERELLRVAGTYHLPVRICGKLTKQARQAGENSVDILAENVAAFCALDPLPNETIDITPALPLVIPSTTPPSPFCHPERSEGPSGGDADEDGCSRDANGRSDTTTSPSPTPPSLPARPPVLCAGCPHRASYFAVKKAMLGKRAVFSADIGCYTLGNALPLDMVDTCICMGGGFTVPQGMNWAQPDVHHFGFVGDSTFFASGLAGAANAVYNQAKVTLCILDNSTTAMTGSQPHPGTGKRMSFDSTQKDAENALRIPAILRALGVGFVEEVNPFDLARTVDVVRKAVKHDGVSAIIFKAPCITVSQPKPQPIVNAKTCTNCKACIRAIGCPALVVRNKQVTIDTALCYGCNLCISICPFNAIEAARAGDAQ